MAKAPESLGGVLVPARSAQRAMRAPNDVVHVVQESVLRAAVGCHLRIDSVSAAEDRSYGRGKRDSGACRANRSFGGATDPRSRLADGLIEVGGCPDRSGLRRSSVVLVNQATQDVPTSDRVVDGERRDVFRSLRRNKVEPAMGSLTVVVLDVRLQH